MATMAYDQPISATSTIVLDHPYLSALLLVTLCCVVTRIRTGLQAHYNDEVVAEGTPRAVPVVPYWTPFLGHSISFGLGFLDFMKSVAYKVPSGVFALKVGGGIHNVVVAPSLTKELLNRITLPLESDDIAYRFLNLSFGDHGAWGAWAPDHRDEFNEMARILHNLMKEPFLSNAISTTIDAFERQTWNLISGNPSWVDHAHWERAGNVEIISARPQDGTFVAEADLFKLVRNFIGDIATSVLMGRAFLENNPEFLNDLWTFDRHVTTFMLGLPYWMVPGLATSAGARERVIKAVGEHHKAMMDTMEGKDPGYKYNDLSDVSSLIWERCRAFHKAGFGDGRITGVGDLVVVWAMNVNANQIVFWMLFFIYSQPELLSQIRAEIDPHIQIHQPDSKGLPIKEAPRLKMDIDSIIAKCPLLKGTFFETMRFELASMSYRVAKDDFVITESKQDAASYGKSRPDKYLIKKGELVCIPYKVHQDNEAHYEHPEKFDARRFWVKKQDEQGNEQITVEYGTMRPWGGGKSMCKGRAFAEREVLGLVAAMLTVWDVEAVGKNGWKHPGDVMTAGTSVPKKDVRVRMWRRKI